MPSLYANLSAVGYVKRLKAVEIASTLMNSIALCWFYSSEVLASNNCCSLDLAFCSYPAASQDIFGLLSSSEQTSCSSFLLPSLRSLQTCLTDH